MPAEGEAAALLEDAISLSDTPLSADESGASDDLPIETDLEDILEHATLPETQPLPPLMEEDENILAPQAQIPFEITNNADSAEEEAPTDTPLKKPQPIPKDTYNTWLQKLRPPKVSVLEAEAGSDEKKEEKTPEYNEEGEGKAKQIAQKSISDDGGIASETLAAVLAMQGHKEKAIAMYERLSLQYPEKSSFFAAKIKELKK